MALDCGCGFVCKRRRAVFGVKFDILRGGSWRTICLPSKFKC
nr:MAG TPA: hypothetical protein [Bacteriophage sp.]